MLESLADITSEEFLAEAFHNAKIWCKVNVHKHLPAITSSNYDIFEYVFREDMHGTMELQDREPIISVSIDWLLKYQGREKIAEIVQYERDALVEDEEVLVIGGFEIDPESTFIHEMVEWVVLYNEELFRFFMEESIQPHDVAYYIENINRVERGLKPRPLTEYFTE